MAGSNNTLATDQPDRGEHQTERWSPTTRDLAAELPALMTRLAADGFDTYRVMFNLSDWDATPRKLTFDARTVRLGGFNGMGRGVVTAIDRSGWNRVNVHDTDEASETHDNG